MRGFVFITKLCTLTIAAMVPLSHASAAETPLERCNRQAILTWIVDCFPAVRYRCQLLEIFDENCVANGYAECEAGGVAALAECEKKHGNQYQSEIVVSD
jgi:hypothetical protein